MSHHRPNKTADLRNGLLLVDLAGGRALELGDQTQWAALHAKHAKELLRFCTRLSGDPDLAEDLVMETLQDAPASLRRFERRSTVRTLLYRIALNKWRDTLRTRDRRSALLLERADKPVTVDLNLSLVLREAVDAIPDQCREAFLLVRIEGFKYREAAGILQVPIGTVQSRVHSACEFLRSKLEGVM